MSAAAIVFWLVSWTFVIGLTVFCFWRILRLRTHHDPDGIGPAHPPVGGAAGPDADEPKQRAAAG
ncbi:MAG: hypothetical protein MUF10_05960 [Thermoanaerobaculaceae bacterium]|nr:hypothetical protein [Thermoanaerobaculaceae bacterium]